MPPTEGEPLAQKPRSHKKKIRVDENACNGCGWCISACQFGAMNMHPDKKIAEIKAESCQKPVSNSRN